MDCSYAQYHRPRTVQATGQRNPKNKPQITFSHKRGAASATYSCSASRFRKKPEALLHIQISHRLFKLYTINHLLGIIWANEWVVTIPKGRSWEYATSLLYLQSKVVVTPSNRKWKCFEARHGQILKLKFRYVDCSSI